MKTEEELKVARDHLYFVRDVADDDSTILFLNHFIDAIDWALSD